ncbi:MAG: nucleotide-binding protein [Phycisphaeraceae bacterium]|nr:nucleotide-binding protein [Phycisphaeraceae bacterium]
MARINARLLLKIIGKTGLSKSQVYARIQQIANAEALPNDLAAIKLAAQHGISINKYADPAQLSQLRYAGSPVAPPASGSPPSTTYPSANSRAPKNLNHRYRRKRPNKVFVVHGRDEHARQAIYAFLRAIGIQPIEWMSALSMSKKAAPYISDVLEKAFANARAIVVLLTPDDLVELRPDLATSTDKPNESIRTGQARPNVLFEAGMAFAIHPDQTLLVQLGNVKEFSDVAGRHIVHLSNDFDRRSEFATKLVNAGCDVDTSGTDWMKIGDFADPMTRVPSKKISERKVKGKHRPRFAQ